MFATTLKRSLSLDAVDVQPHKQLCIREPRRTTPSLPQYFPVTSPNDQSAIAASSQSDPPPASPSIVAYESQDLTIPMPPTLSVSSKSTRAIATEPQKAPMLGPSESTLSDPSSFPSQSSSESNTAHSSDDDFLQTLSPASFSPITDHASSPSPPPSRTRPILQRRHQDIFNVIWGGSPKAFGSVSLEELLAALGLWTREDENLYDFLRKHREFFDIFKRVLVSKDPSELCTHREHLSHFSVTHVLTRSMIYYSPVTQSTQSYHRRDSDEVRLGVLSHTTGSSSLSFIRFTFWPRSERWRSFPRS